MRPSPDPGRLPRLSAGISIVAALVLVVSFAMPALAAATITLDPSEGEAGDSFVVTGQGFGGGELTKLYWDETQIGDVFTNIDGEFTVTLTVPTEASVGEHTVTATDLPPGQQTAEATFTVVTSDTTTTTTESTTTTTEADDTTTTTEGDDSTTTTEDDDSTTTTEDDDSTTTTVDDEITDEDSTLEGDDGVGVGVTKFEVDPEAAAPGEEVEIEAELTGTIRRVALWLGEIRLGDYAPVSEDGSVQVTRTIPNLEPGTYWLKLEAVNGKLLDLVEFEVTERDEAAATVPSTLPAQDFSASEVGWLFVGLVVALAILSVMFMWRKPKDDEEEAPKPGGAGWWRRFRPRREAGAQGSNPHGPEPERTATDFEDHEGVTNGDQEG